MSPPKVFEMQIVERHTRKVVGGVPGSFKRSPDMTFLSPEAESALDECLGPYGSNAWEFGHRTDADLHAGRLSSLWAVIVLDREYRLAGHLKQVRGSLPVPFTPLAKVPNPRPPGYVPGLGIVFFSCPELLQALAEASGNLFSAAWNALRERDPARRWLCLTEPRPADWVARTEAVDDDLFRSLR